MTSFTTNGYASFSVPWARCVYAALLVIAGAALLAGGIALAAYGGSIYYLTAGLASITCGFLIWRGDARGAWLYGAVLMVTLAWSIYEVGFDTWGLVPRLAAPFVLGVPLLFGSIRGTEGPTATGRRFTSWPAVGAGLAASLLVGTGLRALGPAWPVDPLWRRGAAVKAPNQSAQPVGAARGDWQHYGNDQGGTRFSPLDQISPSNVDKLEVAW